MLVLNSKGKPIKLNAMERKVCNWLQRKINANPTGYQVNVTTLTQVIAQVQEQKFFTIPIADYIPLRVGEGAWAYDLLTWQSFATGGDFETGIIDTGGDNSRLASVDAGVSPVRVPIKSWAKEITWSLPELNYATRFGNWDLVQEKERSRLRNWQLGVQRTAFLGIPSLNVPGLMTLPTGGSSLVTYDNTGLTARLAAMDAATFSGFLGTILAEYRTGNNRVAWPNRFLIPESDYIGLAGPTSPTYPVKTKLEMLQDTFRTITGDNGFKVLPNVYGMASQSLGRLSTDRYVLYRYADDSIRMDIPVDYTPTIQSTLNGFHFQNVGYGQFTGVGLYRNGEVMYLDYVGA